MRLQVKIKFLLICGVWYFFGPFSASRANVYHSHKSTFMCTWHTKCAKRNRNATKTIEQHTHTHIQWHRQICACHPYVDHIDHFDHSSPVPADPIQLNNNSSNNCRQQQHKRNTRRIRRIDSIVWCGAFISQAWSVCEKAKSFCVSCSLMR